MPNGRTHDAITIITAAGAFAAAEYYNFGHILSTVASCAVLFSGLMFSPDLDLNSRPYQRWGPLKALWWPYQKALPHRHILSHGLLIGTICRLIYFTVAVSAAVIAGTSAYRFARGEEVDLSGQAAMILDWLVGIYDDLAFPQKAAILAGLWLGELVHVVPDRLLIRGRKRPRARSRRR
jgi:uncharacterized metal-binding protein